MEIWNTAVTSAISRDNHDHGEQPWLPPGFRFHPTDEELVAYYLANKILDSNFCDRAIAEADLNRSEPWELPGRAKMGEKEWYFYSYRDRKYPTGMRTNRATQAGYWKATGKDREVLSSRTGVLVGMKKTLVFYRGRAPKGIKTNWVMHEYRVEADIITSAANKGLKATRLSKDEWVVCRVFHKSPGGKKMPLAELKQSDAIIGAQIDDGTTLGGATLPALMELPSSRNFSQNSWQQPLSKLSHSWTSHLSGGAAGCITPKPTPLFTSVPYPSMPLAVQQNFNSGPLTHAFTDHFPAANINQMGAANIGLRENADCIADTSTAGADQGTMGVDHSILKVIFERYMESSSCTSRGMVDCYKESMRSMEGCASSSCSGSGVVLDNTREVKMQAQLARMARGSVHDQNSGFEKMQAPSLSPGAALSTSEYSCTTDHHYGAPLTTYSSADLDTLYWAYVPHEP